MAEYILKGDKREVEKVIRENRIRINRGRINISPVEPGTAYDEATIKTLEEVAFSNQMALAESSAAHIELAELTRGVIAIAVENGVAIPDDIAIPLAEKFGISVPKNDEIAENDAEIAENENPGTMDDKDIDTGDILEVDIDADNKEAEILDVKDVPESDAKTTVKRSKKS